MSITGNIVTLQSRSTSKTSLHFAGLFDIYQLGQRSSEHTGLIVPQLSAEGACYVTFTWPDLTCLVSLDFYLILLLLKMSYSGLRRLTRFSFLDPSPSKLPNRLAAYRTGTHYTVASYHRRLPCCTHRLSSATGCLFWMWYSIVLVLLINWRVASYKEFVAICKDVLFFLCLTWEQTEYLWDLVKKWAQHQFRQVRKVTTPDTSVESSWS